MALARQKLAMSNAGSDDLSVEDIERLTTKENAVILVDNSNIFIQGKKTYGELMQLRGDSRSWRINYGKLIKLMLGKAGLPADSPEDVQSSVAYGRLFGSFPLPDDPIWSVIREHLDIDLSGRSRFSGKEKQVDAKFVDLAARDSQSLFVMKKHKIPCAFDSRVYCLAGGDGDYLHTVKNILQCGLRVILFSWKNGLGQMYRHLCESYPYLMKVVELDDFIFDIGFEQTVVSAKDFPIPADRSFYVVRPNDLTAERLEDFRKTTVSIHTVLRFEHYVSSCMCVDVDPTADVVAIVINCPMTTDGLTNCISGIRSLYRKANFPDSCVCSFPEFHSSANQGQGAIAVPTFNRYSVLFDEDEDEAHNVAEPAVPVPVVEEEEQFVKNHAKRKATSYVPTVRCKWREFCPHAWKCTFLHSDVEKEFFGKFFLKAPYTMRKMLLCTVGNCTRGKSCHYRHIGEPEFCTRCAKYPCMGNPCSDAYERSALAPRHVIVDLRNKGYIDS